jgi:hypothetical protein
LGRRGFLVALASGFYFLFVCLFVFYLLVEENSTKVRVLAFLLHPFCVAIRILETVLFMKKEKVLFSSYVWSWEVQNFMVAPAGALCLFITWQKKMEGQVGMDGGQEETRETRHFIYLFLVALGSRYFIIACSCYN